MQARREVMEAVQRMVMGDEEEAQEEMQEEQRQEEEVPEVDEADNESYEERHRRSTRRSMQQYFSSLESGEVYTGKGKGKARNF